MTTPQSEPAWHLRPIWRVSPLLWLPWLVLKLARGMLWAANLLGFSDSDKKSP